MFLKSMIIKIRIKHYLKDFDVIAFDRGSVVEGEEAPSVERAEGLLLSVFTWPGALFIHWIESLYCSLPSTGVRLLSSVDH